jgi:type IV pilus assembly protein PilO
MATPAILDKLQKIPTKTRAIAFGVIVGLAVFLFIWQIVIPKNDEIRKLEGEITQQKAKIAENAAKIKQLDHLRAEVRSLHERLKMLTQQLPPESEVSPLLGQIQGLVNKAGLSLKTWRPEKRRTHSSGMYEEIPITLKLTGGYHNVAIFFDSVSKLTRIVNMSNVKMDTPKISKSGSMDINVDCTAMTFAAVEKKVETPTTPTATKQVK